MFGFLIAILIIFRTGDWFIFWMSISFSNRMLLISWISFLMAVRLSWSLGVRFERAVWRRLRLILRSLAKESRNSSHSSMMSRSVFGFLPSIVSIWYFIELKIRTSAFA